MNTDDTVIGYALGYNEGYEIGKQEGGGEESILGEGGLIGAYEKISATKRMYCSRYFPYSSSGTKFPREEVIQFLYDSISSIQLNNCTIEKFFDKDFDNFGAYGSYGSLTTGHGSGVCITYGDFKSYIFFLHIPNEEIWNIRDNVNEIYVYNQYNGAIIPYVHNYWYAGVAQSHPDGYQNGYRLEIPFSYLECNPEVPILWINNDVNVLFPVGKDSMLLAGGGLTNKKHINEKFDVIKNNNYMISTNYTDSITSGQIIPFVGVFKEGMNETSLSTCTYLKDMYIKNNDTGVEDYVKIGQILSSPTTISQGKVHSLTDWDKYFIIRAYNGWFTIIDKGTW